MAAKASKIDMPRSLRTFADQHGARTPEEAMRRACQALLVEAGEATPPVRLQRPLARFNARQIERPLAAAGRLELEQGQYVICVNAASGWRRKRFTVAHEIGHILLLEALAHSPADLNDLRAAESWKAAERLCNLAAAELLVPLDDFRTNIDEHSLSPGGLRFLYDRYLTSYDTLFVRFTESFGPSAVVLWRFHARDAGEGRTFRVVRCFGDAGLPLHEGLPAKHLSRNIVAQAAQHMIASSPSLIVRVGRRWRSFVGLAISASSLRRPDSRSLPTFHGFRVPDDLRPEFDVALFLSPSNQACAAGESCANLLLQAIRPPQR